MQLILFSLRRELIGQAQQNNVQQIQFALPVVVGQNGIVGQVDMVPDALIHVHADPDGVDPFQVVVPAARKIPLLLGGNQSADVENSPIQDVIPGGVVLLGLQVDNDLRKAVLQAHIEHDVEGHISLPLLLLDGVQAHNPRSIDGDLFPIGQAGIYRHGTNVDIPLDQFFHRLRRDILQFLYGGGQDAG